MFPNSAFVVFGALNITGGATYVDSVVNFFSFIQNNLFAKMLLYVTGCTMWRLQDLCELVIVSGNLV